MRIIRFFIWVGLLAIILMIWNGAGSPYVIWSYSYHDNGTSDPFADRYYTSCTFTNFRNSVTLPAHAGRCGWVKWISSGAVQ